MHVQFRGRMVPHSGRGERRGFQIGPKLRLGGSVGKALGKVQQLVPDFRSMVAGAASPVLGLATSLSNGTAGKDLSKGLTNTAAVLGAQSLMNGGAGGAAQSLFSGGGGGGGGDASTSATPSATSTDPWVDFDKRNAQWLSQYQQAQQQGQNPSLSTSLGFGAPRRPWYAQG